MGPVMMTDEGCDESVDWDRYASSYDLLAENNPPYQALVEEVVGLVTQLGVRPGALIADLGAGSGNISVPLAERHPQAHVVHVDSATAMNARAQAKAARRRLPNHRVEPCDAWEAPFRPGELTVAVMVNALYALPRPREYLARVFEWLEPGGFLVVSDPGRVVNVLDWSLFLLKHSLGTHGLAHTLSVFRKTRIASAENRKIGREQRRGRYWTHDLEEFRSAVEVAGFEVLEAHVTYRGGSDLVVARKPGLSTQHR
ncbi:MAG TPA: methyltransferase domain-containing protein [Myxococcaceae bacterium]|nr:methyltransferase domain-containing protein [Myxococcaceae bacterium]